MEIPPIEKNFFIIFFPIFPINPVIHSIYNLFINQPFSREESKP